MHGQATLINRRAVEATQAFSSAREAGNEAPIGRPSQDHPWYLVESQDRGTLAGSTREVWSLERSLQQVLQVVGARRLGCSYCCQGRYKGICELGDLYDRQHDHSGAPA